MKEIFERRSIRKFTDQKIADSEMRRLLGAAMQAPTAGNAQAWEFIVIEEKSSLKEITKVHPYAQFLSSAAAVIIICGVTARERFDTVYLPQNCAAAAQNILLEAQHLKLGGVWLSVYPEKDRVDGLRRLFSIPEDVVPFALIALGYPAEKKVPQNRFDEQKLHREHW